MQRQQQQQRPRVALRRGPQLQDHDGFCFLGPAEKVHKLLDVEKYVPVVSLAPLEELSFGDDELEEGSVGKHKWI